MSPADSAPLSVGREGSPADKLDSQRNGGTYVPPYVQHKTVAVFLIAMIGFAALSAWVAKASDGFVEADGCTHYLYARFAVDHPYLLVNVWARPLVTGINALPAYYFGRIGVRLTSLAIGLICAYATYRIAINQRYRLPVIAVLFLFAQPLFFVHSFSELTELPFAMVVILAFWAYQQREWMVMTVLLSITPLGRPEGFGFILAAAFALICHRKWWWLIIIPLPLVLWSWTGWVAYGASSQPPEVKWYKWLIINWPYEANSNYGSGPIYHYIRYLPAIAGPLLVPAAIFGAYWCLRYGRLFSWPTQGGFRVPGPGFREEATNTALRPEPETRNPKPDSSHRRTCDFVIAALPLGILLVHTIFWFFGKFSGGELRYMLVVGPFWALMTARGWEWFCRRASLRMTIFSAIVLTVAPAMVNLAYQVVPVNYVRPELNAQQITNWYKHDQTAQKLFPRVLSPQPTFFYMMDLCPSGDPKAVGWTRDAVENPPTGTMMVYEPILATYNSDKRMVLNPDSVAKGKWIKLQELADGWVIYLSPIDAEGNLVTADSLPNKP